MGCQHTESHPSGADWSVSHRKRDLETVTHMDACTIPLLGPLYVLGILKGPWGSLYVTPGGALDKLKRGVGRTKQGDEGDGQKAGDSQLCRRRCKRGRLSTT